MYSFFFLHLFLPFSFHFQQRHVVKRKGRKRRIENDPLVEMLIGINIKLPLGLFLIWKNPLFSLNCCLDPDKTIKRISTISNQRRNRSCLAVFRWREGGLCWVREPFCLLRVTLDVLSGRHLKQSRSSPANKQGRSWPAYSDLRKSFDWPTRGEKTFYLFSNSVFFDFGWYCGSRFFLCINSSKAICWFVSLIGKYDKFLQANVNRWNKRKENIPDIKRERELGRHGRRLFGFSPNRWLTILLMYDTKWICRFDC